MIKMLRLKQLRNAKNISREELGEIVGLSKIMIAAFEQDKKQEINSLAFLLVITGIVSI